MLHSRLKHFNCHLVSYLSGACKTDQKILWIQPFFLISWRSCHFQKLEPLCLWAAVRQKQTKCYSLRQFDFQTFKHQYISNKGISCSFWFYSNVLYSHVNIFFICRVHFCQLVQKSISFLTQIIKFSFRTEPCLLTETEIHRESVVILYKQIHIKNINIVTFGC